MDEIKRRPGRPRKNELVAHEVGGVTKEYKDEFSITARHWKRPDMIQCNKDPRFKYRLVEPKQIGYWKSQGFVIDSSDSLVRQETERMSNGVSNYRNLVLMKCFSQVADERAKFYQDLSKRHIRASATDRRIPTSSEQDSDVRPMTSPIGNQAILEHKVDTVQGQRFTSRVNLFDEKNPVNPSDVKELAALRDDDGRHQVSAANSDEE